MIWNKKTLFDRSESAEEWRKDKAHSLFTRNPSTPAPKSPRGVSAADQIWIRIQGPLFPELSSKQKKGDRSNSFLCISFCAGAFRSTFHVLSQKHFLRFPFRDLNSLTAEYFLHSTAFSWLHHASFPDLRRFPHPRSKDPRLSESPLRNEVSHLRHQTQERKGGSSYRPLSSFLTLVNALSLLPLRYPQGKKKLEEEGKNSNSWIKYPVKVSQAAAGVGPKTFQETKTVWFPQEKNKYMPFTHSWSPSYCRRLWRIAFRFVHLCWGKPKGVNYPLLLFAFWIGGVVFQGMTSSFLLQKEMLLPRKKRERRGCGRIAMEEGGEYPLVDLVSHGKKGRKRNQQIEQPRETKKMWLSHRRFRKEIKTPLFSHMFVNFPPPCWEKQREAPFKLLL